jgi:hypothetical protein
LERQGVDDLKQINQIANLALLEWPENLDIGDTPPAEYVPKIRARFSLEEWTRMQDLHALPPGWELMPYDTFLRERRKRMAAVIKRGYETLKPISS